MTYQNPANKVVAILWHQGEAVRLCLHPLFYYVRIFSQIKKPCGFTQDMGTPGAPTSYSVAQWATCVGAAAQAWRDRYGADVPFIAGTFSPAFGDGTLSASYVNQYQDFLRFNFGRGRYGTPGAFSSAFRIAPSNIT